jgi:hypothetical protein
MTPDLYLETLYRLGENDEFLEPVHNSAGGWIPEASIELIEFLYEEVQHDRPEESAQAGRAVRWLSTPSDHRGLPAQTDGSASSEAAADATAIGDRGETILGSEKESVIEIHRSLKEDSL